MIGPGRWRGFFGRELWRDENFDMLGAKVPGAGELPTPILMPGTGINYAGFAGTGVTEYPGHKEYNHNAVRGAGKARIRPHAHFKCTTAAAGNIKLNFEYFLIHAAHTQAGTVSVVVAASGAAYGAEQKVELGEILFNANLAEIGAQIGFRFYRDGGDVQDTYPDSIVIATAGWHYPVDSGGSRGLFTK